MPNGAAINTFQGVCSVSSCIFALFYLTVLLVLALWENIITKSTPKDETVRLSRAERKLVFDLRYYVRLAGFDLESHKLETADGYYLEVDRIIERNRSEEKRRYPVLLLPGLMQSSAAYCTAGPESIAFTLFRAGYDVWLGNNRCGFNPEHKVYSRWSTEMWDWSIEDLGNKDCPAMVEYIRAYTASSHVAVAAHSQGTTQMFLGLSRQGTPDMGLHISSFSALAPAVYAGPLVDRWFLRMLRHGVRGYRMLVGYRSFMGIMGSMHKILPLRVFVYTGYIVFNYMLGWSDRQWDRHYRDRNFIFAPVYVSSKLMMWWLGKGGFADRKCIFKRQDHPWFDHRFPPLALFTCGRDDLVPPEKLINRIHTYECDISMTQIDLPGYSHLDVLWARDACEKVAHPLARFIWENVKDKELWHPPQTT